jgi:glycosyltransferase involved in cell wall biosynthesis
VRSMPRVSALIRVYNAEPYLNAAINSICNQTFADFELILLDNGSNDGSLEIAANSARQDNRVSVVKGHPQGLVHGLNIGLKLARGEFIAILDADDVALPDRFAKQLTFLDRNPECCAVGSTAMRIDPDGLPISPWLVPEHHSDIDSLLMTGLGGALLHPTVMMRKCAIEEVGGYRPEFEWGAEDYDLFLRLGEIGKLANLPEVLVHYRLHINKVTVRRDKEQLPAIKRALEDAKVRRGVTTSPPYQQYDVLPQTEEDLMWTWTRAAFAGRNFHTARKYAIKLLIRKPSEVRRWILLGATFLGPVAFVLRRFSSYRVGPYRT